MLGRKRTYVNDPARNVIDAFMKTQYENYNINFEFLISNVPESLRSIHKILETASSTGHEQLNFVNQLKNNASGDLSGKMLKAGSFDTDKYLFVLLCNVLIQ